MKKRVSAILLALVLVFGLLPATVFAAGGMGTAVYVRSDGNDTTGDGSADKPYATLAKAVDAANDGATVYVMSDLTMTECARFYSKSLTITSLGDATYTITRGDNFAQQQAKTGFRPNMTKPGKSTNQPRLKSQGLHIRGSRKSILININNFLQAFKR